MATARPASQLRQQALTAEARALYENCRYLLEDPDLLDRIRGRSGLMATLVT